MKSGVLDFSLWSTRVTSWHSFALPTCQQPCNLSGDPRGPSKPILTLAPEVTYILTTGKAELLCGFNCWKLQFLNSMSCWDSLQGSRASHFIISYPERHRVKFPGSAPAMCFWQDYLKASGRLPSALESAAVVTWHRFGWNTFEVMKEMKPVRVKKENQSGIYLKLNSTTPVTFLWHFKQKEMAWYMAERDNTGNMTLIHLF